MPPFPMIMERLCVGEYIVPTTVVSDVTVVKIDRSSKGEHIWLAKASGLTRLYDLPKDNVLAEISAAIRANRSKRLRMAWKGVHTKNIMEITVRGYTIQAVNSRVLIQLECTPNNLSWLIGCLRQDILAAASQPVPEMSRAGEEDDDDQDSHDETIKELKSKSGELPVHWSESKRSFLVIRRGHKDVSFRLRSKAARSSLGLIAELRWQRERAEHYAQNGEIWPDTPLKATRPSRRAQRKRGIAESRDDNESS